MLLGRSLTGWQLAGTRHSFGMGSTIPSSRSLGPLRLSRGSAPRRTTRHLPESFRGISFLWKWQHKKEHILSVAWTEKQRAWRLYQGMAKEGTPVFFFHFPVPGRFTARFGSPAKQNLPIQRHLKPESALSSAIFIPRTTEIPDESHGHEDTRV